MVPGECEVGRFAHRRLSRRESTCFCGAKADKTGQWRGGEAQYRRIEVHKEKPVPTILQLTDLHLFADQEALLKGICPWRSLARVLATARASAIAFDHVVLTGDLTHDGQERTYEHLREALGDWADAAWLIPGNHDERSLVVRRSAADGRAIQSRPTNDRVTFSFAAGTWRVIGLDTLIPGKLEGEIGREQLVWLAAELAQHSQSPTLIFMHHPPLDVGSAWLDRIGLTDKGEFGELVKSSPQVRLVCCGHIHQEFEGRLGTAAVLAAPSTSVQFQPGSETLVVDELPPGFRIVTLGDGEFQTRVVRAAG
jgi:Icc protein